MVYRNDEWQLTAYSFVDIEYGDDSDIAINGEMSS